MGKAKKFNAGRFHDLMDGKIKSQGYRSVSSFVANQGFSRTALARAMAGMTRPSLDSLNAWCKALNCTPEERAEIIASVYIEEEPDRKTVAA